MPIETVSIELYWLTLTVVMTGLMWIPYILNRMLEQGIGRAIWDPQGETKTRYLWAERMMKAHKNAVENLIIFAPLVLILHLTQLSSELTEVACMIYFIARLAHYLVFSFGIPFLRVLVFMISVASQLSLGLTILAVI